MSFEWTDFLTFAESLQSNPDSPGPQEAALRSATSRAYYAAFHQALDLACKEGYLPRYSGDDHKSIQTYFRDRKPPDRVRRKVALELERLSDNRRLADYRDTLDRQPVTLAYQTIAMAKSVLRNLDALSQNKTA